jgi:hypothetical protein
LLFRLLYYLVPFAISLAILGGREILVSARAASRSKTRDAGSVSGPDVP